MTAKIKAALITTATVLVVIYFARRVPVASDLVNTAFNG